LIEGDEPVDGLLGGPLRPSDVIGDATVINVSGSSVEIRYNGKTTLSLITSTMMEAADALFTQVGGEVAESMKGFDPANRNGKNIAGAFEGIPDVYDPKHGVALGIEFEARLHRRFSELAAQGKALAGQFLSGVVVDNTTGKILASTQPVHGATQVDVLFVKKNYVPQVGQTLDRTQVLVYEVKTSASGAVEPQQFNRLQTLTGQPVRGIHSPLKYIADGAGSFKVAQNTRFRAFVNLLSAFGKRLPQALQGVAIAGIGLRAMSAEAAVEEDRLLADLEINIEKVGKTMSPDLRHLRTNDGWNIIEQIMSNRGIKLDPTVRASVIRQIYTSAP